MTRIASSGCGGSSRGRWTSWPLAPEAGKGIEKANEAVLLREKAVLLLKKAVLLREKAIGNLHVQGRLLTNQDRLL